MTIEGEKDDITGVGQTTAAHELAPTFRRRCASHLQKDAGHYGIFNGSRFRAEIAPRICAFHACVDRLNAHARSQAASARRPRRSCRPAQKRWSIESRKAAA